MAGLRRTLFTALLFATAVAKPKPPACATDADCGASQTCYRAGTEFAQCIAQGALGSGNPGAGKKGGVDVPGIIIAGGGDGDYSGSTQCANAKQGLRTELARAVVDEKCRPMFRAFNISVESVTKGSFDVKQWEMGMIASLLNSQSRQAKLATVCGSPCYPDLYATVTRSMEVCYGNSAVSALNYVCTANEAGKYCLNYGDDLVAAFQQVKGAGGKMGPGAMSKIMAQCGLVEGMGCCFETYMFVYGTFRTKLHQVSTGLKSSKAHSTVPPEKQQQIESLDDTLQSPFLAPDFVTNLVKGACKIDHLKDACPIPEAVKEAIERAATKFPAAPRVNNAAGGDGGDDDDSKYVEQRSSGHVESGLILAVGLGCVVVAGIGAVWWYARKRSQRPDGAGVAHVVLQNDDDSHLVLNEADVVGGGDSIEFRRLEAGIGGDAEVSIEGSGGGAIAI